MARRRLAWTLLLLGSLLAAVPLPSSAQETPAATEIRWRTDYATAIKEAQDRNLPLAIDIGTVNCYWCKKLDESTFRDAKIVGVMNERFIPRNLDAEKEATLSQNRPLASHPPHLLPTP